MYGVSTETWKALLDVFVGHNEVSDVILYGSRAEGNYRNGSDIDLCLKGEGLSISLLLDIMIEIDDLLIPYEVDVCIYEKIENQALIDHIDRVGISLSNTKRFKDSLSNDQGQK